MRAVRAGLAVGARGVKMRRQRERVDEAAVRAFVHERHHRSELAPRRDAQLSAYTSSCTSDFLKVLKQG